MKKLFSPVIFLVCFFSAQEVTALDLNGAVGMALKNHEAILMARETVVRSELGIDKARSNILPKLTLEGNYTRFSDKKTSSGFLLQPEDSVRFEVRLEQPVYSGGRSFSLMRQARKSLDDSRTGTDEVREEVAIETVRAYYAVLRDLREVEISDASLKRSNEQKRVAEAKLRIGTGTKSEFLRSGAEAAGAEAELTRARAQLNDSQTLLKRLTGAAGPIDVTYEPREPIDTTVRPVEIFVETALENRRDYKRKLIAEEIAEEGVLFAKGSFMPTFSLEGIYIYRDQTPSTTFLLNDVAYGGMTVKFPVYEGGLRRAELREARSSVREAELARLDLRREIELEVRVSYNRMVSAASAIGSFTEQVSFARENYAMVFKQFKLGISDNLDVIDADTTLVEAEKGLLSATFTHELAAMELLKSSGVLLDTVLKKLNGEGAR
jgi:outer membrane protein